MRSWQPALLFTITILAQLAFDQRYADAAPPKENTKTLRCALIDVDQSAIAGLVEAELITRPSEHWLERTEIQRLLEEKQLQSLLAAGAGDDRVALGQTLKADVLVILRTTKEDQQTKAELVVAETNQGLRLLTAEFFLGNQLEEHAAALVELIDQAITKARQEIRQVFAVPPFVSDDLTYEYEYLKATYAKLLEQSLLDMPGVVIVELEEARAIASELELTTEGGSIQRALPVYLLGQFRNEGKEDQRKVQLTLNVQQGSKQLDKREAEVAPSEVARFLRENAQAIAEMRGIETATVDPAIEAQQLNRRAQQFAKLGDWDEALELIEASLMLHPDQPEMLSEAIRVAKRLGSTYSPQRLDELAEASELNRRSLKHLKKIAVNYSLGRVQNHFDMLRFDRDSHLVDHDAASPLLKREIELEEVYRNEKRRFAMQLAHRFAEQGDWKSSAYLANQALGVLLPERRYAELAALILKYQDQPNVNFMVRSYAQGGYTHHKLQSLEGRRFIEELAIHPDANQQVKQAAGQLLLAIGARDQKTPTQTVGDPNGETQLTFRPIQLTYRSQNNAERQLDTIEGCLPLDQAMDVFYGQSGLFIYSKPQGLRQLWQAPPNTHIQSVSYDGKYVWMAATIHLQACQVWVFDPGEGKGVQLATDDGLPLLSPDEIPGSTRFTPTVSLTTVAEGRAIVAGHIGRTWLADVRYDPSGEHQVQIFHEAKEILAPGDGPADWRNALVAFQPAAVHVHHRQTDAGERQQVVVIDRASPAYEVTQHPLLVDPEGLNVRVCEHQWLHNSMVKNTTNMYKGAHYYTGPLPPKYDAIALLRVGLPDFIPDTVIPKIHEGQVLFNQTGEVNVVGGIWQRGRIEDGKLTSFGPVPWLHMNRFAASGPSPMIRFERGSLQLGILAQSNNFGTIVSCQEIEGPAGIVQVLFDGSGMSLRDALRGGPEKAETLAESRPIAQATPVENRNFWQNPTRCIGVAFSPDDSLIVTTSRTPQHSVQVWSGENGKLMGNLLNDPEGMTSVVFSHDGKTFATGGVRGRVIVWDAKTLQPIVECEGQSEQIVAMAYSWKDDRLVAAGQDWTASVWTVPDGKHLYDIEQKNNGIRWVGFSADDSILIATSYVQTNAFEAADGDKIGGIEAFSHAAGFLEDGTLLAIASDEENTLVRWNSIEATAQPLWRNMAGEPLAVSSDGQLLATRVRNLYVANQRKSMYRIEIWDLPTKTRVMALDGFPAGNFFFTPDKEHLLVTNPNGGLRKIELPPLPQEALETKRTVATRTWTDSTGKHQRQGIFQRVQGKQVELKTSQGQSIFVPLDRLSAEDQNYVREQTDR